MSRATAKKLLFNVFNKQHCQHADLNNNLCKVEIFSQVDMPVMQRKQKKTAADAQNY